MTDPALNYNLQQLSRAVSELAHQIKRFNDNVDSENVAALAALRKSEKETDSNNDTT